VEEEEVNRKLAESYANEIIGEQSTKLRTDSDPNAKSPRCYLRIFAILALLERILDIATLIEHEVCDAHLPLVRCEGGSKGVVQLSHRNAPKEALECFKLCKWRSSDVEAFELWQWRLTVPFFDLDFDRRAIKHADLPPLTVLPWSSEDKKEEGGFAVVTRVKMDPACHGFHDLLQPASLPAHSSNLYARLKQRNNRSPWKTVFLHSSP
jgi:hypothetical protein